jgi:hypothetical protein
MYIYRLQLVHYLEDIYFLSSIPHRNIVAMTKLRGEEGSSVEISHLLRTIHARRVYYRGLT